MACYVPYCGSVIPYKKGAKRDPDVSFHQFPSDPELRKKWIVAIDKKDLKTGAYLDPFGSAFVCSLHFSPKQFNGTAKYRFLKKGSIPFIFPDHHLPERGALLNQLDLSSIKLIPHPINVDSEKTSKPKQGKSSKKEPPNVLNSKKNTSNANGINNTNKLKRTFSEMDSPQMDSPEIENVTTADKQPSAPKIKIKIFQVSEDQMKKLGLSQLCVNKNLTNTAPATVNLAPIKGSPAPKNVTHTVPSNINLAPVKGSPAPKNVLHTVPFSVIAPKKGISASKASVNPPVKAVIGSTNKVIQKANTNVPPVESSIRNSLDHLIKKNKILETDLNSEKDKNKKISSEFLKLQEENARLKFKSKNTEEMLKLFNIAELQKGIVNSNAKSLFLMDQLCNFKEGTGSWSESTVEFFKKLEVKFPACYGFLRQEGILNLPTPKKL